jgi:hypothetical protein
MRFPIRVDPWWRPLLLAGGATRDNSYVEVTDDRVSFRFGFFFRRAFSRDEIEGASLRHWPIWMGVGWRSNLRGVIGLIGSYRGVVEVRLKGRSRVWALFPCDRIAASLEDPEGFIEALSQTPQPAKAAPTANSRSHRRAPGSKRRRSPGSA